MKFYLCFLVLVINVKNIRAQTIPSEGTIINLYDAFGKEKEGLTRDWGFSCILNYHGKIILFDGGSNADIFAQNIKKLNVDLSKVDLVIVSHAHFDHINGLDYLLQVNPKVKIYFPYDIFWGAPVPFDATGQEAGYKDSLNQEMQYFGGKKTKFIIQQSGRFWNADIEYIKESKEILPGLKLIATASPFMGYFSKYPNLSFAPGTFGDKSSTAGAGGLNESGLSELSLSAKLPGGELVVVGCSHSGIERIADAVILFTKSKIDLIYGGFHLLPYKKDNILQLADYLKNKLGVRRVAPAHCTGHLAFKLFKEQFQENYLFAGLGEVIRL